MDAWWSPAYLHNGHISSSFSFASRRPLCAQMQEEEKTMGAKDGQDDKNMPCVQLPAWTRGARRKSKTGPT